MIRPRILLGSAVAAFLVAGFGAYGLVSPSLRSFAPSSPSRDFSRSEGFREDLRQLKRLPEVDGSFDPAEVEAFNRALDQIAARADVLLPVTFEMMVSRALAIGGNGHTYVRGTHLGEKHPRLPIDLWLFEDGVYIVAATPEFAGLAGKRLLALDGRPVEQLIATLHPYLSGIPARRAYRMPNLLTSPALLHAVGLAFSPQRARVRIATETGDEEVELPALPLAARHIVGPRGSSGLPIGREADASGHERHWLDGNLLYVRLGRLQDPGGHRPGIESFLAETVAEASQRDVRSIIVDLRASSGGDYLKALSFSRRLPTTLPAEGRLLILVGRATFSAGLITAARLSHFAGNKAVLIGESMGDRPDFWAEGGRATLPHSGIELRYSNAFHDWASGCSLLDVGRCFWMNFLYGVAAGDLSPQISIPLRHEDHASGRDRAFEAALGLSVQTRP